MVGKSSRDQRVDPVTGETVEEMLINPLVRGDTEDFPDSFEVRIHFDQIRKDSGLDAAKEAVPDWEDYTLPGDPYPIPRNPAKIPDEPVSTNFSKGQHGFLANTDEEGWEQKMIAAVRGTDA